MGQLAEKLKKYLANPDEELANLPGLIDELATFEADHETFIQEKNDMEIDYQNRFATLQKTNRELVRQIPTTDTNPNETKEPELPSTSEIVRMLRDEAFGNGE